MRELIITTQWRKLHLATLLLLSSCRQLLPAKAYDGGETSLGDGYNSPFQISPTMDEEQQQGSGRALEETDRPTLSMVGPGSPSFKEYTFGEAGPSGCPELDLSHFKRGRECGLPLSIPCFDYKRCHPKSEEGGGFKVYVYDEHCSLDASKDMPSLYTPTAAPDCAVRHVARELGLLAETYESACLFIHVRNHAWGVKNLCATSAPSWNNGANHLMVDFTDQTRCEYDAAPFTQISFKEVCLECVNTSGNYDAFSRKTPD